MSVSDGPVSGKVVHYDPNRGFGFLAPDAGGADVFVHINDLPGIDESSLTPGSAVQFEIEETDRGSKAVAVSIMGAPAGDSRPRRPSGHGDRDHRDRGESRPRADRRRAPRGDGAVDAAGFSDEVTELLLDASGTLTASQIVAIRRRVVDFAIARGWVSD